MHQSYLIAGTELRVILEFVFVQACGHLHNVMDLQLDDFSQRSEHTLWNDLQYLPGKMETQLERSEVNQLAYSNINEAFPNLSDVRNQLPGVKLRDAEQVGTADLVDSQQRQIQRRRQLFRTLGYMRIRFWCCAIGGQFYSPLKKWLWVWSPLTGLLWCSLALLRWSCEKCVEEEL